MQRMFVHFARLSPCAKMRSVTLTYFFVAQTVTIGKQRIIPESDFLKEFLPTPTNLDQTPSDYPGLVVVVVFKISSKYVGITCSLATRWTLGIPKLLKCISQAQPEPCYKKHSSGAMLTQTESSGAGAISYLQGLHSPNSNPL